MAERLGQPMPYGWCIDKDGLPTDCPEDMRDGGSLVGLGSDNVHSAHKGYGLSAWVDIMSAVLSGACWGPFVPPFTLRDGQNAPSESGSGHQQVCSTRLWSGGRGNVFRFSSKSAAFAFLAQGQPSC